MQHSFRTTIFSGRFLLTLRIPLWVATYSDRKATRNRGSGCGSSSRTKSSTRMLLVRYTTCAIFFLLECASCWVSNTSVDQGCCLCELRMLQHWKANHCWAFSWGKRNLDQQRSCSLNSIIKTYCIISSEQMIFLQLRGTHTHTDTHVSTWNNQQSRIKHFPIKISLSEYLNLVLIYSWS